MAVHIEFPPSKSNNKVLSVSRTSWLTIFYAVMLGVIGLSAHYVNDEETADDEYETWMHLVLFIIPAVVWATVFAGSIRLYAPSVSEDLLKKRSGNVYLKDACCNIWTNTGLLSALALSITAPSAVDTVDPATSMISKWIIWMFWCGSGFHTVVILKCALSLMYANSFSEYGIELFCRDFPRAIGEPAGYMIMGCLCCVGGLNLMVYQKAGLWIGTATNVLWPPFLVEVMEFWHDISGWESPEQHQQDKVEDEEKDQKEEGINRDQRQHHNCQEARVLRSHAAEGDLPGVPGHAAHAQHSDDRHQDALNLIIRQQRELIQLLRGRLEGESCGVSSYA